MNKFMLLVSLVVLNVTTRKVTRAPTSPYFQLCKVRVCAYRISFCNLLVPKSISCYMYSPQDTWQLHDAGTLSQVSLLPA